MGRDAMSRLIAGRATLWSALDIGGRQGVQLITSIILARLLSPSDFGAIAIMLLFASLGTIVLHASISTALVRHPDCGLAAQSILFWWSIGLSLMFGLLLVASGDLLARFYAIPILAPLMVAAAVQLVAAAPGIVPTAILTRQLRFADIAIAGTITNIVSGAAGIGLALAGYGVWALAVQLIVAAGLGSALYWWRSRWSPRAHFAPRQALRHFQFAGWMLPANLLDLLNSQGFALIVGKLYGSRDLGLYGRASNLQQIPQNIVTQIIGRVSLPLFARRGDDSEALARGLLGANRLVMLGFAPLMLGIAACPRLILAVLFGPQWVSAAPYLAILALAALPFPLIMLNLQLLLARGEAPRFLQIEMTRKALALLSVLIGSFSGLAGLAWSQLAVALMGLVVATRPTASAIDCGLGHQLANLGSTLVAAAAMAVSMWALDSALDLPPLVELALLGLAGVAVYAALCVLLRVKALGEAFYLICSLRSPAGV